MGRRSMFFSEQKKGLTETYSIDKEVINDSNLLSHGLLPFYSGDIYHSSILIFSTIALS